MTADKTEFQADRQPGAPIADAPRGKWKVQRFMAVASFIGAMVYPLLGLMPEAREFLLDMAVFFYGFCGSVVLTWYGSSTIASWKR